MKGSVISVPDFPEARCHRAALSMKCPMKPLGRPLGQIKFDITDSPRKGPLRCPQSLNITANRKAARDAHAFPHVEARGCSSSGSRGSWPLAPTSTHAAQGSCSVCGVRNHGQALLKERPQNESMLLNQVVDLSEHFRSPDIKLCSGCTHS